MTAESPHQRLEAKSNIMTISKRVTKYLLAAIIVTGLVLFSNASSNAQSSQLPTPTAHINDFAGVVDAKTKTQLEAILVNLKERSKIEFYIATVDTTDGQDIFDYSNKLASDWNIGARNSASKSLLLVVSVASKTSFTRFSRSIQNQLPDGVLGEMTQRMREPLSGGRFGEALDQGVRLFAGSIAQKLGFTLEDLEKSLVADSTAENRSEPQPVQAESTEPKSRPRVVKGDPKPDTTKPKEDPKPETTTPLTEVKPTNVESSGTASSSPPTNELPKPETSVEEAKAPEVEQPQSKKSASTASKPVRVTPKTKTPAASTKKQPVQTPQVSDEDEEEEVELTLTLPLPQRAIKLKSWLESHPNSKFRGRATELLISTHAGLGDQELKNGEVEKGIQQLMLAIEEADVSITDQLFSGVISQIPSNLYLRGQADAAFKASKQIEEKFGADPKRLLIIAGFYLGLERGEEAVRLASRAIELEPQLAEAHRVKALGLHLDLKLDDALEEYKRTVEIDSNSRVSRSSLADLSRANGKFEEALALYNELLASDPKDRTATAGRVISLLELGRKDEAVTALDTAIASEPQNLALLSGAAYWFAAHGEYEKSIDLARRAVAIEPRYTWAQIALVRSLIGVKKNIGAERVMRYTRQYGKFPTLNYELANVLTSMGFYAEAEDVLKESFSFKEGQVETLLAGRIPATGPTLGELLSPERRASIYQPTAADTAANSAMITNLLAFASALTPVTEGAKLDVTKVAKAAEDFGSGSDPMRTYRQIYAADRLVRNNVALDTALQLAESAKKGVDAALEVSVATSATQADEFRELRAQSISNGQVPEIAEAPKNMLGNLLRGRIEELSGWILFNQDKYPEAIEQLKKATTTLPEGTPAWRTATWHLGVAYEQSEKNNEALESYIKSYNSGFKDPSRRAAIEKVYRKINGSLYGLDDKIGGAVLTGAPATENTTNTSDASRTPTQPESTAPASKTSEKPASETTTTTEAPKAEATPTPTPEPTPETPSSTPTTTLPTEEEARAASARLRSNIKITGRVFDSSQKGLANVVVVLISPSGSVIASTTDREGNYSFTVLPSQKTYRLIPSKEGYTFTPVDKTLAGLLYDQKDIDFVASP